MSLKLLIDGYNVVSPTAPPKVSDSMWLHRERMNLINRLVHRLPPLLCEQTCVVFDAANPPRDRPHQFNHGGIDVRFAVDYPEADDLIEELIAADHSPKQLTVISSDHRVQAASKRRGATFFESQEWLDELLDGNLNLAKGMWEKFSEPGENPSSENPTDAESSGAGQGSAPESSEEVDDWMREFGFDPEV